MQSHNVYRLLLVCVFPLFFLSAQKSKVIELRYADTYSGKTIQGEQVRELLGNVHFVQPADNGGLIKVWCDRALQYLQQNKIELFGNVKAIQDSVTIRSSEGVYYGNRRMMEGRKNVRLERGKTILTSMFGQYYSDAKHCYFLGNVVLIDTGSTITCNELFYFEPDTRSVAIGNVHVFEHAQGTNIYGDSLVHVEKAKMTHVFKHPRMVKIDTTAEGIDTMVIVSNFMQSYQDTSRRFIAIDSVRMVKDDMASRCGKAIFLIDQDSIILEKHPIIWSDNNQISGDSIRILMKENRLHTLWVKQHTMAISPADTALPERYNQLTGKELTMFFLDNKLHQVDVQKNATSLYYLFDNQQPNGLNKSSGDRIFIDFLRGEADRLKVVGGVQGQYFPEKMIRGRELEYNLDGFRLYTNRPVRNRTMIVND